MLFLGAVLPLSQAEDLSSAGQMIKVTSSLRIPESSQCQVVHNQTMIETGTLCTTHHSLYPLYKVNFWGIRQENIDPPSKRVHFLSQIIRHFWSGWCSKFPFRNNRQPPEKHTSIPNEWSAPRGVSPWIFQGQSTVFPIQPDLNLPKPCCRAKTPTVTTREETKGVAVWS